VRKGDTLGRIAQLFNTDIEKIIRANALARADDISVGQTLVVPDAHPRAPAQPRTPSTLLARLRNLIIPQKRGGESVLSRAARFIWPTSARRITQYFNWRHGGVDIAGPPSNKIYAAASGHVILSGWQRGYGLTLLVDHGNGYVTRYGHARKLFVRSGEYVEKGETIAMIGNTGRSTGPHLHFEVLRNGHKINPLSFVR
jgi:murein DD-endopeptidase MepM/ murein hydrolase activator NlpD